LKGGAVLTVRRPHKNYGDRHIALPNYPDVGFCGEDLFFFKGKRRLFYLREIRELKELCPRCRETLERMLEEHAA
jgi:hypothetical protein